MDPKRLLSALCRRHGLAFRQAADLLPVLELALDASDRVRDRILAMVEDDLARASRGEPRGLSPELAADLDKAVLSAVARVLHAWTPSPKMLNLGGLGSDPALGGFLKDLSPEDEAGE